MTYYEYQEAKKRKRRTAPAILFLLIISIIVYFVVKGRMPSSTVSPLPSDPGIESWLHVFEKKEKNPEDLKKKIIDEIGNDWKNYSIIVRDYNSEFLLAINDSVIYSAASVNKLPILASLYYLIQTGDIDPDRIITIQADDIQDYGTGSIRYDEPGSTYSIKSLARLMIEVSDNTAAYILARQIVGVGKMQTLVDSWGMAQTDIEENKTSNADISLLMKKIFDEKVANKALTLEMQSFLKNGEIEDRIPAQLPDGVTVYHKTGNDVGFVHDVGVVESPTTKYYVGFFTSDISDEPKAIEKIARLSRIIYEFMK